MSHLTGPDATKARREIESSLELVYEELVKTFGVMLLRDHDGALGNAGAIYLTLRLGNGDKLITVQTRVERVTVR